MMTIQQEIFCIVCTIKIIINLLALIDQEKKNTSIPQQISFTGKSEEDDGATMFLLPKTSKKLF